MVATIHGAIRAAQSATKNFSFPNILDDFNVQKQWKIKTFACQLSTQFSRILNIFEYALERHMHSANYAQHLGNMQTSSMQERKSKNDIFAEPLIKYEKHSTKMTSPRTPPRGKSVSQRV